MSSWITGELNDKIIINVEVTDDVFEIVMNNQRKAISKAVAEERERCAKVLEEWFSKRGVQFGCAGYHHGIGTKECPKESHHHHDDKCENPATEIRRLK